MKKILFIDNTAHHLYGQLHNIKIMSNCDIYLLVPNDKLYFHKLQAMGYKCLDGISSWRGQNPILEFMLILKLKSIVKSIKPDLICSFTIKPNLYSAIAIKNQCVKQIANITGLGYAFMNGSSKVSFFTFLYRYAFSGVNQVFFQNKDDFNYFKKHKILGSNTFVDIIPGSGVDIQHYSYTGLKNSKSIKFLYSGRLLLDKGINELVNAFCIVKQKHPNTELVFIGNYFPNNPTAINESQIKRWIADGLINYLGMVDNVSEVIAECDCMVLASYREGMPRSLLEASSMGKPIITVDSVGCKDVVENGVTGYIAKVRDVNSLADAMIKFIELPFENKERMGMEGRRKMEQEYDQKIVISKYLEVAKKLLGT